MREDVQKWLELGAEVQEGLRLLSIFADNHNLVRLVTLNPKRYKQLLINTLCKISGAVITTADASTPPRKAFREKWSFLAETDCPPELKILAADKITAYYSYVESHCKLFDCTTIEECFSVAETLIKSFIENRKILYEFAYYTEHHTLLGRHPIFKEMQALTALRSMGIVALIARKKNIKGCIWRIRHELAAGSKPYLDIERRNRLQIKERELNTVEKLINEYE